MSMVHLHVLSPLADFFLSFKTHPSITATSFQFSPATLHPPYSLLPKASASPQLLPTLVTASLRGVCTDPSTAVCTLLFLSAFCSTQTHGHAKSKTKQLVVTTHYKTY